MSSIEERVIERLGLEALDRRIAGWMRRNGLFVLRIGLGIVFIWFGLLKPLGMSPAEELVRRVVYVVPPDLFLPILGWWEVAIGIGLLYRPFNRTAIFLLFLQMPGTLLPLVLLPEVCFTQAPWGLTLEGQYIIKNAVLIGAALVVGGTVREPDSAREPSSARR
ncbi:MAG: hypothetical protein R6T83_10130 [Salinibacter sp.]